MLISLTCLLPSSTLTKGRYLRSVNTGPASGSEQSFAGRTRRLQTGRLSNAIHRRPQEERPPNGLIVTDHAPVAMAVFDGGLRIVPAFVKRLPKARDAIPDLRPSDWKTCGR
jgi:hypothetical protein